jgi:SET domain-containing protein
MLGLGNMFNHSFQRQNVGWKRDLDAQVVVYTALKDIEAGQELLISYGPHLTFVDIEKQEEQEEEEEEEPLGRIALDL